VTGLAAEAGAEAEAEAVAEAAPLSTLVSQLQLQP